MASYVICRQSDVPSSLPTSDLSPATPSIRVLATVRSRSSEESCLYHGCGIVGGVRRLVLYDAGICRALAVAEGAFRVLESGPHARGGARSGNQKRVPA